MTRFGGFLASSEKGDPLETIAALVPWESFRADIEAVAGIDLVTGTVHALVKDRTAVANSSNSSSFSTPSMI